MSRKPTLKSEAGKLKEDTQVVLDNWVNGRGIEWNILHLLRSPHASIAVKCYFLSMVEEWSSVAERKRIVEQLTQAERTKLRAEAGAQQDAWIADGVRKAH